MEPWRSITTPISETAGPSSSSTPRIFAVATRSGSPSVGALEACAPLGVNVEIKNSPHDLDFDATVALVEPTVAVIKACSQPIIVSSFHSPTLDRVRAVDSSIATAQLTFDLRDPARTIDAAVRAGHVALHPFDATVTHELVELTHVAGLTINVWTVDDPARIEELAEMGVDGIVTNVPDVAAAVLRG